jgi:hypothetical protein
MKTITLIVESKYIIVKRNIGESVERMIERGYFILKYMKENNTKFEETETLSYIWANIVFDKSTYDISINNKLKKYI